jgi:hypothetical protein
MGRVEQSDIIRKRTVNARERQGKNREKAGGRRKRIVVKCDLGER